MFVDAHCHLDDPRFDAERPAVFDRAEAAGVVGFMLGGVDPEGWARQRRLAERPKLHWSAGLHPWRAATLSEPAFEAAIDGLPACFEGPNRARAVGELGLDARFCPKDTLPLQRARFERQLGLAIDLGRPVVLHVVGAHQMALEALRRFRPAGMVHAFGGSPELAEQYLALGLSLSFGGPVSDPQRKKMRAAATRTPPERLMIETDAPDQAPPGFGEAWEPAALPLVARALGALRGARALDLLRHSASNLAAMMSVKEWL